MERCEDCIHYNICTFHVKGNECDKCTHFKNAADVVEVVRCKDCKYFKEGDPVFLRTPDTCWYFSGYDDVEVKPDGFCSYGERKEQT